jgi:Fe-S oxidoreductase
MAEFMRCTSPMLEVAEALLAAGGEELKTCYQCGTCTSVCPWGNLIEFSPRRFIETARLGLEGFEENSWTCVQCRMCQDRCPQQIDIPQLFRAVRGVLADGGSTPPALRVPLAGLRGEGNPWVEPREKKTAWARKNDVPALAPEHEIALFACCANEYEARNQRDGIAVAGLMKSAGLSFGYMGEAGTCCGDLIATVGAESIFESLRKTNVAALGKIGARTTVTVSPHCLNSFRNRYPAIDGMTFRHVTELWEELVRDGVLKPRRAVAGKVTYHDPCYLGRHNGVYEAPRNVLKAIPGLELVEMAHHHERSICCGGGGGGAWMERPKGERLGDLRVREAVSTGADTLVTACPYCVQMLEASVLGLNLEGKLKVRTVSELLSESIAQGGVE